MNNNSVWHGILIAMAVLFLLMVVFPPLIVGIWTGFIALLVKIGTVFGKAILLILLISVLVAITKKS